MQRHFAQFLVGRVERRLNPFTRSADHLQVDAEFAPVIDHHAGVLCLVGIEHGGNVVLCVTGSKQHAWHRQHAGDAVGTKPVEPFGNHRVAEFQIAIFHMRVRVPGLQAFGHGGKFLGCVLVTAAMATDHDTCRLGDRALVHNLSLRSFGLFVSLGFISSVLISAFALVAAFDCPGRDRTGRRSRSPANPMGMPRQITNMPTMGKRGVGAKSRKKNG